MNVDTWLLYITTILIFMLSHGPSHLLMISVGLSNGFKKSLATAAGDLSANVIQIALAGFGLAAVVLASQNAFTFIKWAGVAYLVWIGIKTIRASFVNEQDLHRSDKSSISTLWLRGFVTSAANPKAVVFFVALFPQFIDSQQALTHQVLILGITYIVIDGMFLCFYGLSSSYLSKRLKQKYHALLQRISGVALVLTACWLASKES